MKNSCLTSVFGKLSAWILLSLSATPATVSEAGDVTESFSFNWQLIYQQSTGTETVAPSLSTGFKWGAYGVAGGASNITTHTDANFPFRILGDNNNPGTYIYTIFDSTGGNTADQTPIQMDFGSVVIDPRAQGGSDWTDVRMLILDAQGDWYLSDDSSRLPNSETAVVIALGGFTWQQVTGTAAANMSALDNSTTSTALTLDSGATSPDLSFIQGGGLYIDAVHTASIGLDLQGISWHGVSQVGVELDLTHGLRIDGELSIERKNLFTVHKGSSNSVFSAAQDTYLYDTLDVYNGRVFGVDWMMDATPEDSDPARAGYWEDSSILNTISANQTSWQNAGSPGHDHISDAITTVHPAAYYPTAQEITDTIAAGGFATRDHAAIADLVSLYLQRSFPRPTWFEVSNEINGEAGALGTTWNDVSLLHVAIADKLEADGLSTQVVGFGGKWPAFEVNDFSIFDRDWVDFIDVAGASVDGYSVHLYQRTGVNSEAILDMIGNYSHIALGYTQPLMISEFGHLVTASTLDEEYWLNISRQCTYFIQLLNRGGLMGRSIPFNTQNSTLWSSALVLQNPSTSEWEWTDTIKLYELWKDFDGIRLPVTIDDPDVIAHAALDGNVAHLALNNPTDLAVQVNLSQLTGGLTLSSATISRLYYDGSAAAITQDAVLDLATSSLTMAARETVVISYVLSATPSSLTILEEDTYFGDTMTQAITSGVPIQVNINGVDTGKAVSARLRISMGNIISTAAWTPTVTVNGNPVTMSDDQMGESTHDLRAHEVVVPASALAQNNVITVTYPATGGRLASAVLVVASEMVPQTIHVDGSAGSDTNDGLSWANAKATIQSAISVSDANDQIWVAQGSYDEGALNIPSGVALYGGFLNGEASINTRDFSAHTTILSPAYVRVVDQSDVHIDGLTLTGAVDGFFYPLQIDTSSGGADVDNVSVANCRVIGNNSRGAVLMRGREGQVINNVSFDGCEFANHSAAGNWLGMMTVSGMNGQLTVRNSIFHNNTIAATATGPTGAGLDFNSSNGDLLVENCLFYANQTLNADKATGIYLKAADTVTLTNITFGSGDSGSAASSPLLRIDGGNSVAVNNCLFTNSPNDGVVNNRTAQTALSNCQFFGNAGSHIAGTDSANDATAINALSWASACTVADPLYVGAADYRLQPGSPAIDQGADGVLSVALTTDLAGKQRTAGLHIDLGAYENLDQDGDGLSDDFEMAQTAQVSPISIAATADGDSDGLDALAEFTLGLDPSVADASAALQYSTVSVGEQSYLSLTYRRATDATDFTTIAVQRSTDLGLLDPWNPGETTHISTSAAPGESGVELVTERSTTPMSGQANEFLRLSVEAQ